MVEGVTGGKEWRKKGKTKFVHTVGSRDGDVRGGEFFWEIPRRVERKTLAGKKNERGGAGSEIDVRE